MSGRFVMVRGSKKPSDRGPVERDGMIDVHAFTGGRPLTLDPVIEREPVPLPVRRVESSIPAGFRVEWLSGDDGHGMTFSLGAGAGFGSPFMVLTIKHPTLGEVEEIVDMRDVLKMWIPAAVAAGATPSYEEEEVGT